MKHFIRPAMKPKDTVCDKTENLANQILALVHLLPGAICAIIRLLVVRIRTLTWNKLQCITTTSFTIEIFRFSSLTD